MGQVEERRDMVTINAEKIVRNWWINNLLEKRDIALMSEQNAYNCRNMLAGFLQACEQFGHLTNEECKSLFKELAR